MTKSKIEWCDYSLNPVKGLCPMACKDNQGKSYCYARAMYKRFRWNPEIRYEPIIMTDPFCYGKPSKIFVGSTMELFGDWIKPAWLDHIFEFCQRETNPRHTFIFLTKQPQNLIKWSPFPENCWVGVTATDTSMAWIASKHLSQIEAKVKFLSIEPLLSWKTSIPYTTENIVAGLNGSLDWLIIGAQTPTSAKTQPKAEWIQEIVEAVDKAGIPIFLKDNLRSLIGTLSATEAMFYYDSQTCELRQELPNELPNL